MESKKIKNENPSAMRVIRDNYGYLSVVHCTCGNYHIYRFKDLDSSNPEDGLIDTAKTKKSAFKLIEMNINKKPY